ncbi:MAG: NADH-quinone oxidoreductase subunit C, partial [Syntrophales bacterium]|nr:NADH-quinone oxidoreductase subunit C [Syntrophales bacterium]
MTTNNLIEKYLPAGASVQEHGNLLAYELPAGEIVKTCENLYHRCRLPLKAIVAFDERAITGFFRIMYVFGIPGENVFPAPCISVESGFPSLTPSIHEASTYERKIKTFFGLIPHGHPDPRPLILHENWPDNVFPLRKDFPWNSRPEMASGEFPFRKISGDGIYEIPVGPVHAGIIEPGHFRFSVIGETIFNLEIRMFYKHRGVEKLAEGKKPEECVAIAESISGDETAANAAAFCTAVEKISEIKVPLRAWQIRTIFLELERIYSHLGDMAGMITDVAYPVGASDFY